MKVEVFISYVRENSDTAKKLYNSLKDTGVSVWRDEENLLPGQNWEEIIPRVIENSTYFLVLLSSQLGSQPGFVHKELKIAFDLLDKSPGSRIFIIPVRLDDCNLADIDSRLKYIHYIDLFPSYEKGLRQILNVLEINKTERPETPVTRSITLTREKDKQVNYKYKVQKLLQKTREKKLTLNWDTFIQGLQDLKEIIIDAPAIAPDIIFGVNEIGIIIAAYLSHHLLSKPHVGIIKTTEKLPPDYKRRIKQFDFPKHKVKQFDGTYQVFPNVKKPKSIAIVDKEIKSGASVKYIMERLRKKYGKNIYIYYFVLCGAIKPEDVGKHIDDIRFFGPEIKDNKDKPDFLAYYIEFPGIKGPEGMR